MSSVKVSVTIPYFAIGYSLTKEGDILMDSLIYPNDMSNFILAPKNGKVEVVCQYSNLTPEIIRDLLRGTRRFRVVWGWS